VVEPVRGIKVPPTPGRVHVLELAYGMRREWPTAGQGDTRNLPTCAHVMLNVGYMGIRVLPEGSHEEA
jgi:hypothetical protein